MELLDRLRPRWRHPDPDVRAAAVRELGHEHQDRLREVARTDADARVRRVAIKRLDDAVALAAIAEEDDDAGLRELAAERVREVALAVAASSAPTADCEVALALLPDERSLATVAASAAHADIRAAALGRLSSDRALRDVVRAAGDPAIRRAAIDRIRDGAVLRALALGDGPPDVVVQAVERIADAETLRAVAESRTASKAARQRARALLPADAGAARPPKDVRARQLELSILVHGLRGASDLVAAGEAVREAQREWDDLAAAVDPHPDVAERYRSAAEWVLAEAVGSARRRAEVDHARLAVEESLARRTELCERVERADGGEVPAAIVEARAVWARLASAPAARGGALARRFDLACRDAEARYRRWETGERTRAAAESIVTQAEALAEESPVPKAKRWHALEERWRAVADGAAVDLPALAERLAAARERLERRRQEAGQQREDAQRRNVERLAALCARAMELASAEVAKAAAIRRELASADAALADPGALPATEHRATWIERISEARDQLLRRLAQEEQAEEWRRWANAEAQEEIIARLDALLATNDMAEGTRMLATLQDDWARVATASPEKSQALWERFRTARNELRRRCDAYLAENLEKKRALCAAVAGVGDSSAWNETAELVRRAQAEWKAIGPVPGKHAKSLWQQFREPCDRFFARRKEHFDRLDGERRENASRRVALCEQAEALADSTDWDATTEAMKRLQAEWKRSGPPPRDQADVLWRRFKTACDRFFDRRSRRGELAREEMTGRARAICERLEAVVGTLADEAAADAIRPAIDGAWAEWVALDAGLLDDAAVLATRLDAALTAIATARPSSFAGTRLDPAVTRERRAKLCARLEKLVGTGAADAPARPPSLQEMAQALRDKLATNTIAGRSEPRRARREDVAADVQRVVESWARLGPPLDAEAHVLAERFAHARARIQ